MSIDVRPELLVTGARVQTFGPSAGGADAMLVGDGRVLAVGAVDEIVPLAGGAAQVELDGGCVLPGFCDTHMHLEKIAAELSMVQLGPARSIEGVLDLIHAQLAGVTSRGWCQSFGDDNAWHERQLAEGRLPTRLELDSVASEHPVFVYRGPDAAVLNSAAITALGDRIASLDGWQPESGLLRSPSAKELQTAIPIASNQLDQLGQAAQRLLGFGITSIVDPGLPGTFEHSWQLYREARAAGLLAPRTWLMDRLDHRLPFDLELSRVSQGPSRFDGDDRLHGFGLKLILDGEFGNAWMREGEPQGTAPTCHYTLDEIRVVLRFCFERGWPATFHVMGGGAIAAVLAAADEERVSGRVLERGQLTLAHVFYPSADDLRAIVALGISLSVQPLLAYVFEEEMTEAWGEAAHRANPFRLMLDLGADVSAGSDVLPCEPLRSASYAVNRRSRRGSVLGGDQALRPLEALSLHTSGAANYLRRPGLGALEPGSPADFVWWPHDPLALSPDEWPDLTPGLVAVAGETVWEAGATFARHFESRRTHT